MQKKILVIIFIAISYSFQKSYTKCEECKYVKLEKNIYHEKFKDLLLVINFNLPHYENIQYLRDLYSSAFENIVFYGEKPDPNVYSIKTDNGYYISGVLQDVLTRFPQYKGYLILQDDCILNFWNCISLDQNKIWYSTKFVYKGIDGINIVKLKNGEYVSGFISDWWKVTLKGLTVLEAMQLAYANLTPVDLDILQKNIGKDNATTVICDFFYIPSHFRKSVMRLSQVFKNIFCECAITTMLCCLDSMQNWENLDILWGVGYSCSGTPLLTSANYQRELHWIHPVKFSNSNNRAIVSEIFNNKLQMQG